MNGPEFSRRRLLAGGVAGGAALAAGAAVKVGAGAATAPPSATRVDFHGPNQAGILTPPPAAATFVALDVTVGRRADLQALLRTLTARARFLTTGGTPPVVARDLPPPDSGVLGPVVVPDALTMTVGVGPSLFDDRFGLASRRPARLRTMPVFPNDRIDPRQAGGDVLVQLCANNTDTCVHALRDLLRHTRGALALRWKIDGFQSPSRGGGTARNLLGFKDGTANPVRDDPGGVHDLVFAAAGEPAWASGGSYQVVRIIRMLVEFWDRVSLSEQEEMIGRRRDTGAALDRSTEFDAPDYTDDPSGLAVPTNAHIRLANPRTPKTDPSRILRRGYNYSRGFDEAGNLDMGLVFCCYCADVDRQFAAVQDRLNGEPLEDYVKPFGGGYFYALPGVRGPSDWYGSGLVST